MARLRFETHGEFTDDFRERVLDLWTEVTREGGAVGFVRNTPRETIAPFASAALESVRSGLSSVLAGYDDDAPGQPLVALAFLESSGQAIFKHWRTVKRLMVHPRYQGRGCGADLLRAVTRHGHQLGLDYLYLTCRGGSGVEKFYAKHGYAEVGRFPRAIRLAADDYRDEVHMRLDLTASSSGPR